MGGGRAFQYVVERRRWRDCGADDDAALGVLAEFRREFYWSLTRRRDALFELADAVACGPGRVTDLARLSLAPEFGRGHGALYDALNAGHAGFARVRRALAGLVLPGWPDGGIRLAVDVCNWLRPEAVTSPQRLFCHVHGRGKNAGQVVPGGRTRSWPSWGRERRAGRCRWMRCGWAPAMMTARSPPRSCGRCSRGW
jgi:DDE superfamily endonuclease